MFALVDCNNFYVSCERVFQPRLENSPVVILSNNDGCVISRSNEAKTLDIPMGAPAFKYLNIFKKEILKGSVVRAIPAPKSSSKPRSFFDELNNWAKDEGGKGLGYVIFEKKNNTLSAKGPISKFFSEKAISQ